LPGAASVPTRRSSDLNAGVQTRSDPVTVTVVAVATNPALPAPWTHQDVGSTGQAGSAAYGAGTFTVRGAGADIWGTNDAFQYVNQEVRSDGLMVAWEV